MFQHNVRPLLLTVYTVIVICRADNLTRVFSEFQIVPYILTAYPKHQCELFYNKRHSKDYTPLKLGERAYSYDVDKPPIVKWPYKENALYTLYMTGSTKYIEHMYYRGNKMEEIYNPDAPTRKPPVVVEWEQWIVINIPKNNISLGEEILFYLPPRVPYAKCTDYYTVLIYEQPDSLTMGSDEQKNVAGYYFGHYHTLKHFVEKYRLGDPWAGHSYYIYKRLPVEGTDF